MRFIAASEGNTMVIDGGTVSTITHRSGVTEFVNNGDYFDVTFQHKTLSVRDIAAAKEQLMGGPMGRFAFGSHPGIEEGNINIDDARLMGYNTTTHDAYDPYMRLGIIDTEDPRQVPPERKEEVEQILLNHEQCGLAYVRVDDFKLAPPWPTYPSTGEVKVDAVVKFATAAGLLEAAHEYELVVGKREDLVAAYEAALKVERSKREEDAGLTARV